jgi:glutamate synthase (NADPH/NADH) small chain
MYGHSVTIFEAFHKMGGVLIYGIPEFRLPKAIVQSEVDYVLSFGGIEKETDCFVSQTYTVPELRKEFDAVFFATGAGEPSTLGIPGQEYPGAMTANEWLTRINLMHGNDPRYETHVPNFKNVVVFGGGNVAMDAARSSLRVGIEQNGPAGGTNVTIAYRRTRKEMPARAVEIEHALEEGVNLQELIAPIEILHENGRVIGVKVEKNKLGEPDASGRQRPVPTGEPPFVMPAELVITAIGQKPNPAVNRQIEGVQTGRSGNIRVDLLGRTSVSGCFAGGDLSRGGATVILAMGDGKTAAYSIDQYLRGKLPWPTAEEFTPVT